MPTGAEKIGRYELIEMIGQGGMGRVYRARDPLIDRVVAIKTIELADAGAKAEELRPRILREVRAAGRLLHPHIVQIFDVGELPDKAYIVMELVEGRTLWDLYDAGERPGPAEAVRILEQVADALDYAHEQGIVHRDVKPGNVLIDAKGVAKITDFGIARIMTDERLTQTGMIVGTPHYMAPEQLQEAGVGPAADQFALAVNAYELLTGQKPFDGESFSSLLYMVLNEEPPPLAEFDLDLPPSVEQALRKGLAKDRGDRYLSCRALTDALQAALAPDSAAVPAVAKKNSRRLPWALAAAAAALAAIGAVAVFRPSEERPPTPPAAVAEPATDLPPAGLPDTSPPQPERAGPESAPETPPQATPAPAKAAQTNPAPAKAAPQPASPPPAADSQSAATPLAVAPAELVTVVWRGKVAVGETLEIAGGEPSAGSLSRPLPTEPIQVEVSPSNVEIIEAPGPANEWKRLRVRNTDHERTMFFIRYRRIPVSP